MQNKSTSVNDITLGQQSQGKSNKNTSDKDLPKASDVQEQSIPISKFFKNLDFKSQIITVIGLASALICGVLQPGMSLVLGSVTNAFGPQNQGNINSVMVDLLWKITTLGLVIWIFGYIYYALMQQMAETIAIELRGKFLRALMRQEIGYFEMNNVESMPSDIGQYFTQISKGIGESYAQLIVSFGCILGGVGISFYKGPILALICVAYFPVIAIAMIIFGSLSKIESFKKLESNKELGGFSEEQLAALKLTVSFAQEDRAVQLYDQKAAVTRDIGQKANLWSSLLYGIARFTMFGFFIYCYYIASILIQNKTINPNSGEVYNIVDIVTTVQGLNQAIFQVMQIMPNIANMHRAGVVGKKIFDILERQPLIQSQSQQYVHFRYPTAPKTVPSTLQGVNFFIKAGTSTAIVGASGSGKSTIVQMIERFYDPIQGNILLDDKNLKEINLTQLRESIGYVSQEPVLILGTIKENMLFANQNSSDEEIKEALNKANANFVDELENGIDTYIGTSSLQNLSGGQKQRIAIARALLKKPKILILDEATSALDPQSEIEVQNAIENIQINEKKAGNQLTIIMIAHRLQTIQTAENLLFINNPQEIIAAEKGTSEYDSIMKKLKSETYKHQKDANEEEDLQKNQNQKTMRQNLKGKSAQNNKQSSRKLLNTNQDDNELVQLNISDQNNKSQDQDIKPLNNTGFFRVMTYYSPKSYALGSVLASIANSTVMPLFGWIFSEFVFVIMQANIPGYDYDGQRNEWILNMLYMVIGSAFAVFFQRYFFTCSGENLTFDVRNLLFKALIYKQVSWFDQKERAPGILTNILSEDITNLNGLTSETLCTIFEAILCLAAGITASAFYEWRMTVVCIIAIPFVMAGGIIMAKLNFGHNKKDEKDPYAQSNALLSDIILNYRTIISFGQNNIDQIMNKYEIMLTSPAKQRVRNAHIAGAAQGYSLCIRFVFIGVVFYVGSIFSQNDKIDSAKIYKSIYIIFTAALGAGFATSAIPSASIAKISAQKIFNIIDEQSTIDVRNQQNKIKLVEKGEIVFKNVQFQYPSRQQKVLNELSLTIPAGKKIGLVGHSGCGKSTITNLLLRFYDYQQGQILIDGNKIEDYNISELRKQIGYVMQEPILFNMSIKENILFGKSNATDAEIRQVAEMSNSIQFIESNYEELTQIEQIAEVRKKIIQISQSLKLNHISHLQNLSDLWLLQLIQYTLENCDSKFQTLLQNDQQIFINIIQNELNYQNSKGMKWDDLIIRTEWKQSILDFLKYERAEGNQKIIELTQYNSCQFDEQMIKEFLSDISHCRDDWQTNFKKEQFLQFMVQTRKQFLQRFQLMKQDRLKQLYASQLQQNVILHQGFEKNCGLKGQKLSGGQKQRIAIARALIKNPKILILDEATSALDEGSQEIVQQALDRAMENRTSIVIAHRLSTIRNCELLFVINNGEVVEFGSYDELIAKQDSFFNKLKSGLEM